MKKAEAWGVEWARMREEERAFLEKYEAAQQPLLTLQDKVPVALHDTLEAAFSKAFSVIFEKGSPVIERTYRKEELERRAKRRACDISLLETRRSLRAPARKAQSAAWKNAVISGAEGACLGVLGMGLPDVPIFVGILLRGMYETSLHYGYPYEGRTERYFILKLMETACSSGVALREGDLALNRFIESGEAPGAWLESRQVKATSAALSDQVLYLKFLQGVPLAGAVGGVYNAPILRRVLSYACLKYQRRLLRDLRREEKKTSEP